MSKYKRIGIITTIGTIVFAVSAFAIEKVLQRKNKKKEKEEKLEKEKKLRLVDQEDLELEKRQKREEMGWKYGSVDDFLNSLFPAKKEENQSN